MRGRPREILRYAQDDVIGAPPEFFQDLRKVSGKRAEGGVYSAELTVWQIMRQRLDGKGTLSTAVQEVA